MSNLVNGGGQFDKLENKKSFLSSLLSNNFNKPTIFFLVFLFLYCVILVSFSRYTFNLDDIWMWSDYIYPQKIFWMGYTPETGRFWPLAGIDLNILMQFSNSPYLFFSFNAFLVIVFSLSYLKFLNSINSNKILNSIVLAFYMLSVGAITVIFGICYPERPLIASLSIFVLCSFYMFSNPSKITFIIGIIALNLSIYLKEPVFIAAFVFGGFSCYHAFKSGSKILKYYSFLIFFSALIFIILYFVLVYNNIDRDYSALRNQWNTSILTLRGYIDYMLTDGIIIFLLFGVIIYRIFLVFCKKDKIEPFFDGLLMAGFTYFIAFMVLGLLGNYYLLPCYIFSGGSLIYFLIIKKYLKNIFIKICLIFSLFGFFAQSLPNGIFNIINLKVTGIQFNDTLDFTAKYLKENPNTNIYFDGIGRGYDIYREYYSHYFVRYLNTIYNVREFDVKSNVPNSKIVALDVKSPYTINNSELVTQPKSKDLLILSNATINNANKEYIDNLLQTHNLLYKTNTINIPYISLKPLLKYVNSRLLKVDIGELNTENIFRLPYNTYVFEVK